MDLEEIYCSAGVNPRSHCIAITREKDLLVYAADRNLTAQVVSATTNLPGNVIDVSPRYHTKPITVVKRISSSDVDYFISGCNNGDIILWQMINSEFHFLMKIDTLPIAVTSLTGVARDKGLIVCASWGGVSSGMRSYWLSNLNGQWIALAKQVVREGSRSFALSIAVQVLPTGNAILAAGTSLNKIDLYIESYNRHEFVSVVSMIAHDDWIHSIAFNNNQKYLLLASAGQDSYIRLWRIIDGVSRDGCEDLSVTKNRFNVHTINGIERYSIALESVLAGHEDWVHSTEFNNDGTLLVTASSDKSVVVWKEIDGIWMDYIRFGVVGGQAAGFFSAVFTNDSKGVVASSYFGGLHCWREFEEGKAWYPISMLGGHVGEARDLSWDRTGNYLITVGSDKTTRVHARLDDDDDNYAEIARAQVHGHEMQCVCSVDSTLFVSGGEEKILRAFRAPITFANSFQNITQIDKEKVFDVSKLAVAGARLPALGLSNKAVEVGETIDAGEAHWEEGQFQANPMDLLRSPTEDILQQSTLWPEVQKLYGHGFEVYSIASNSTGKVLATSCKASQVEHAAVLLWEVDSWTLRRNILGHKLTITQIEWSPDSKYLLTVSRDRTAIVYKERTGDVNGFDYMKFWQSKGEHSRIIWSCSWFSNSTMFATGSRDKKLILWSVDSLGVKPFEVKTFNEPITAVAVNKENVVVCGLQDGSLVLNRVVDGRIVENKALLVPAVPVDAAVARLRFSESQELAYACLDGKVRIFKSFPEEEEN